MISSSAVTAKILMIDDSVDDLRVLIELISRQGYRLSIAFNGKDGYRKAITIPPDLILLDVRMPGMDGFATCRLLKSHETTQHVPVIFLTAANDPNERITGFALGAVDYIAKPFVTEQEVLARIGIHLCIARRLDAAHVTSGAAENSSGTASASERALVQAATRYLAERLADPPSPAVLARMFGCNEKRLNQAFRSVLALPIYGWLREERMRLARHLLAHTETQVREIGEHLGYPNPANFATAFRARFGASPREFRVSLHHQREDD